MCAPDANKGGWIRLREMQPGRVLERMGTPERLAGSIARAHQTPERLLAAAGSAVRISLRSGIPAVLVAWALVVLGTVLVATVVSRLWVSSRPLGDDTIDTVQFAVVALLSAFWLGTRIPREVADRSRRSLDWAQRFTAVVGAAILVPWMLLWVSGPQSLVSVVLLALVPVGFAVGCRLPTFGRDRRIAPMAAVILVAAPVLLIIVVMMPPTSTTVSRDWDPAEEVAPAGLLVVTGATLRHGWDDPASGTQDMTAPGQLMQLSAVGVPSGYADVRFEVWRQAEGERHGTIDPVESTPVAAVSAKPDATGSASGVIDLRARRSLGSVVVVLTGLWAGERHVLDAMSDRWTFGGTALEWLATG